MQTNLDQQLETIERNGKGWKSLTFYDRALLQQLGSCLQSCLSLAFDNAFLNVVINKRPTAFDTFECVASHLFKQWSQQKRSLADEQLKYLTIVGTFNRRMALTLQNDNDDPYSIEEDSERKNNDLEHQKRVRELLFDHNNGIFDVLMTILPTVSEQDSASIEMVLPWYESYVFFEHSYIDSTLDERFLHFYRQIMQQLQSNEYQRSLLTFDNNQTLSTSVRHRFYLGVCTLAMGIHVNCDENECEDAKALLESYLPRYIAFIHQVLTDNQINSLNSIASVSGIVAYLVNYTLIVDNDNNRQLLMDLFAIILQEDFYANISINWSTYETILIDSTICYLIIYCFDNRLLVQQILRTNEKYTAKLERLIDTAQTAGNRRIAIMTQLLLLILSSGAKKDDLPQKLFLLCLTYIQMSLGNKRSYHYNRIPMSLFFKSIIHSMKYPSIQEIVALHYLNLFTSVIVDYDKNNLSENAIYQECAMITVTILWSLSFNESIRKLLKQCEQNFFDIVQTINTTTNEISIKQATCGLLYNLERLNIERDSTNSDHNFGKTIGISYDPSDFDTVQMIEQELNRGGHRVWTSYDHMNDHFVPSFISLMSGTQHLIVCLSDMYRVNNRCRTELLYATTSGHRVLSWKIQTPTSNPDENECIRLRAIETLLKRVTASDQKSASATDISHVNVRLEKHFLPTNFNRRRRTKEIISLENWSNAEVLAWCQSIEMPGFLKLFAQFDGPSVIKLYEFCKQNSTETIAVLNNDLQHVCKQHNMPDVQITIHEFIRFQIEVEKVLSPIRLRSSSMSFISSKPDIYIKRWKTKTCSLL